MAHRQLNRMISFHLFAMLMLLALLPPAHVVSLACNACGPECANACGSPMFRACCFNYNRKRSIPMEELDHSADDIAANLSGGTDGTRSIADVYLEKINPIFKNYWADKWFRLFEKNLDRMQEKKGQYYVGNYAL